ncbi:hypothetical protein PVMG_03665 [Plasmodium vivax Mauritania I]|uniref:Variable surface protein Vir35 n=1 Tax=Plasmodium vivax Mauritania I TaxID=1035515 RepID=A0A0J9T9W9_PLAVI|nr:hypothetical protein PVMG_03665 [Plasmodium vivax Mauritania I]
MRHFRLLAIKNGIPKELEYASCGNAFSYEKYKKLKMKREDPSTYKRLKREGLNDMEIYKKSFQCKYNKKNGLAKLDCYCEKKIFDKLEGICLLAKNMKDEKKCFKKLCKIYGLSFTLLLISVITAGIINILDSFSEKCLFDAAKENNYLIHVGYSMFFYILPIIILLVLTYIMIKVIKYGRLVEGKVEGKRIANKISCYYDDEFNST